MTDYKNMSLEELQKLQEEKKKADIIASFMASDAAKLKADTEAHDAKVALQAVEDYKNSLKPADVKPAIVQPVTTPNAPSNEKLDFLKEYTGGKLNSYEGMLSGKPFDFANSDAGCDVDVSSWSPDDIYVNAIWHTMYESSNLLKVAVKGLAINKGQGLNVQIRTIARFDKSDITTTSDPCECLSCVSTSFSTYNISLAKHGISTEICEYDVWDVGEVYRKEYAQSLAGVWAEFFDWEIYEELETATPGHSSSLASTAMSCDFSVSGSCCTDASLMAFYNAIDEVITDMRSSYYKPDFIIMHPTIARIFRAMQTPQPVFANTVEIGKNGSLKSILGVPVIEFNAANSCSDCDSTGGDVAVIVIDSRRAVGAAFGKKPKMERERNITCDSTTLAMWTYFGCAELDSGAIGHIIVT
ncbi:MAG: hypothetical protein DRO67_07415 [Candidatus Asgardarchaeum californiense]|nr:MAG: hypothetical protein DRO67_07415 [Candidatus Asgardarchaeum californiense]